MVAVAKQACFEKEAYSDYQLTKPAIITTPTAFPLVASHGGLRSAVWTTNSARLGYWRISRLVPFFLGITLILGSIVRCSFYRPYERNPERCCDNVEYQSSKESQEYGKFPSLDPGGDEDVVHIEKNKAKHDSENNHCSYSFGSADEYSLETESMCRFMPATTFVGPMI